MGRRLYWMAVRLPPTPRAPRLDRSQVVVLFYGALTVVAVMWAALRGQPNILIYGGRAPHRILHFVSSLAIGTAVGLLLVLLTRILQDRYAWARVLHNEFRELLGPLDQREILLLAAASAIGEECFFRGALLPQLASLLPGLVGVVFGVVGSSALFALLHIGPGARFLPWTLSSLGVGVLLGTLYVGIGDLVAPIAIHFTINLLNLQDIVRRQMPA
ncbi:MAG: CPBP family intramembrane metalloprotease [Myxococcota bacterium]|nr:CPBP family intramembrane metalloprotease [Myxococcota bacterium]